MPVVTYLLNPPKNAVEECWTDLLEACTSMEFCLSSNRLQEPFLLCSPSHACFSPVVAPTERPIQQWDPLFYRRNSWTVTWVSSSFHFTFQDLKPITTHTNDLPTASLVIPVGDIYRFLHLYGLLFSQCVFLIMHYWLLFRNNESGICPL